jgi:hypothetical protein
MLLSLLLVVSALSIASSNLLVSKHYFDPSSDCTGDFDLVQIQSAGGECIPSKCSIDKQFGGKQQAECVQKFEVEDHHVIQEFHSKGTNCTKEPFFALVHGSSRCRNLFGEYHVFECSEDGTPYAFRYESVDSCLQHQGELEEHEEEEEDEEEDGIQTGQSTTPQKGKTLRRGISPTSFSRHGCHLFSGETWETRLKGCSHSQTYAQSSSLDDKRVVIIHSLPRNPQLHALLSGSLWEEETEGDHAGGASAIRAMSLPVQILLGLVSFLLTLAALD